MTSDQALYPEPSGLMIPCTGSSGGEQRLARLDGAAACAGWKVAGDPEDDDEDEEEEEKKNRDEDEDGDDEDDEEEPWRLDEHGGR